MMRNRLALCLRRVAPALCAAGLLGASPAHAVPRYDFQRLPDLGYGGRALGLSHDTSFEDWANVAVVGDVADAAGVRHAALWRRSPNGWQLRRLPELGYGSSAHDVEFQGGCALVAATVRDAAGTEHAALFDACSGRLQPFGKPGGPGSAVHGLRVTGELGVLLFGTRQREVGGPWQAALWQVAPGQKPAVYDLPGLGGLNSGVEDGIAIPDDQFRMIGCAQQPGSDLFYAYEVKGSPERGFTASLLPAPAPGLETYHVTGVDPLFRFSVGAQYSPGGGVQPAGWATFPYYYNEWEALRLSYAPEFSGLFSGVNSLGRAVGWETDAKGRGTGGFTQVLAAPGSRPIPLIQTLGPRFTGGTPHYARRTAENGAICGCVDVPGDAPGILRPYVLLPTRAHMADVLTVQEGQALGVSVHPEEFLNFWADGQVLRLRNEPPGDTITLLGHVYTEQAPARGFSVQVTAAPGTPRDRVSQTLCLWDFTADKYLTVATVPLSGGRPRPVQYRVEGDPARFRDPATGEIRFRVRWTQPGAKPDFEVQADEIVFEFRR